MSMSMDDSDVGADMIVLWLNVCVPVYMCEKDMNNPAKKDI